MGGHPPSRGRAEPLPTGPPGPKIDGRRLRETWEAMARIGATEAGGVTRLALSDADREARDLLRRWCEEDGRPVAVDDLGNVYCGRLAADAVVCGSHLDSVARGGRFDGVL